MFTVQAPSTTFKLAVSLVSSLSAPILHPNSPVTPVGTLPAPSPKDYRKDRPFGYCRLFLRSYQPMDSCVSQLQPKPGNGFRAHSCVVETQLPCVLRMC